jgi:hypothetical protein
MVYALPSLTHSAISLCPIIQDYTFLLLGVQQSDISSCTVLHLTLVADCSVPSNALTRVRYHFNSWNISPSFLREGGDYAMGYHSPHSQINTYSWRISVTSERIKLEGSEWRALKNIMELVSRLEACGTLSRYLWIRAKYCCFVSGTLPSNSGIPDLIVEADYNFWKPLCCAWVPSEKWWDHLLPHFYQSLIHN